MSDYTTVRSLEELQQFLDVDGARVRLLPGDYRLYEASCPDFLRFSGNDALFDLSGVRIQVDTSLLSRFEDGLNILLLAGNRISLTGLSLRTIGNGYAPGGCRAISVTGDDISLADIALDLEGSYPYGYGSYFGIGQGASIPPRKMNGIRIGGMNDRVARCIVVMRGFGHGIFVRGGQNALIEDCAVVGALRKTDDILAETSGLAYDQNFTQYTGQPIPAGRMTSLSEDGIRAYPEDPLIDRETRDVYVRNCRVTRMRRAICLAFASGSNTIEGCEVTESERLGYHIGSNTTIRECKGDTRYTHLLDISSPDSKGSDVEMEVTDSGEPYGHSMLAKINGADHRVSFSEQSPGVATKGLTIELGTDKGFGQGRISEPKASSVELMNGTSATTVLHPYTTSCSVTSRGTVEDDGTANKSREI